MFTLVISVRHDTFILITNMRTMFLFSILKEENAEILPKGLYKVPGLFFS